MATAATSRNRFTKEERKVILASSLGTVFEWYDFFIYGSIASILSKHFFANINPSIAFILTLMVFAVGFILRPVGAILFGRFGDVAGRKYTFLITITVMGLSTFMIGIIPSYAQIGIAAPIILVCLRALQGLAIGGEYGGAAIYVAEHAPRDRRGEYTAWIQISATAGLVLSLLIILGVRIIIGEAAFSSWGWRIPFLFSLVLLIISVWIRLKLKESPAFMKIKNSGRISKAPLSEAFSKWKYLRPMLIVLFGLVAGETVVWYTAQFYALYFLTQSLKVDLATTSALVAIAAIIATPLFILFGRLSDKIGRKPIILGGCLIASLTFFPLFHALAYYANPALAAAQSNSPVIVTADPADCHFQFKLTSTEQYTSSCDIAKAKLSAASVSYTNEVGDAGTITQISVGDLVIPSYDVSKLSKEGAAIADKNFADQLKSAIANAGYPEKADPVQINKPMVVFILVILMSYGAMTYGPLGAIMVEMFPTRIRYTALSVPYHIANGWIGGLLPTTAFALVAYKGDIYYGLWYPIVVAFATVLIGWVFVKETKSNDIYYND